MIKEYFANYFLHNADVTFDMSINRMDVHQAICRPWKVTLVDTGEATMTGRSAEAGRANTSTRGFLPDIRGRHR